MDGKRIRCLQIVSQHVPIYLQQFPSYSNRKCKKSPFSRTAAHIFVSPGDAPATITQYVAWMERQMLAKPLAACTCLSSIVSELSMLKSMLKSKNRYFYHIFVSLGDAPGAITLNVVWMEREFDAYKLSRSLCPSKYNRFWDTARYSWKKSAIFHTPLYSTPPLGGFSSEYRHPLWYGKTRMVSLPDGEKISKISLFVLAQLRNVPDRQTDTWWQHIPRLCICIAR